MGTIEVIESNDPVLAPVENVPSSPEMIDVDDVPESVAITTPQAPVEVPVADKAIPAVETAEPIAPVASEEKPVADEAVAATDDATDNTEESVSNVVESADNDKLAPGTAAAADSVTAEEPTGDKTEVTTVDTSPAEVEVVADIATDIDEQGAVKPAEAVDVTDQVKPIETAADSDAKATVVDEPVSAEASADIVVSETEPISATAANNDVFVAQPVETDTIVTEVIDNSVTTPDAVESSAEDVVVADENVPEVDQPVANVTEAVVTEVSEVPDASVEAVEPTTTEVTVDSTVTSESSVISNEIEQIKDVEPVVDALISEDAEQTTTPDAQPENVATNESTAEPTVEDPIPAAVEVLDELVVTPDEP